MTIYPELPSPFLPWKWNDFNADMQNTEAGQRIITAWREACEKPGWNPKTVVIDGALTAVDYSNRAGNGSYPIAYKTTVLLDHPFLKGLPDNAPRTVRHIYRKETRLRYLRQKDVRSYLDDLNRAEADWYAYIKSGSAKPMKEDSMTREETMIFRASLAWARAKQDTNKHCVRFLMPSETKIISADVSAYDECLEIGEARRSECGNFFIITWKNYKITVDQSWNRA